ncbi:hypothetical protein ACWCYO_12375, partial [Kitasatospora sp. NPDC001683]
MTVLHSRNADAADPADVADAADVKDPQDAAAEPDLREDLGRYAELGAFTLSADTHAWYAAVDTVATPEDARAASTALAELRGRDLQQTWEAVTALAAEVKLDEPDTVAKTALLVEMLQRVHRTSAILTTAAYDADLVALAAATADSTWRRENGVKLSWLRGRSLRKQATALAHDRKVRREDLHEALTSAEIERRAWAALAPAGTLPSVPADGALVERTAQAFEPINTSLRDLARLLPDHDLDGLAFAELVDLVERLAADEGTLYRLPTIRALRATLEEAGLADLLAELAAAKADRRAAEAAYTARQALAGGQRNGLAEPVAEEADAAAEVEASDVEASDIELPDAELSDADAEAAARQALAGGQRDGLGESVAEELVTEEADVAADVEASDAELPDAELSDAEADAEAAARQALAGGQRDGLTEETPVSVTAPVEEATEVEAVVPADVEAGTEVVEVASGSDTESAVVESAAVESAVVEDVTEEAPVAVVSLPAPSPAADDLVAAATAALAEAAAVEAAVEAQAVEAEEPAAEVVAEVEVEAEPEAVAVQAAVEATAVEVVEPVTEAETVEEAPAVVAEESEAVAEVPAVEAEEPVEAVTAEESEAVAEVPAVEAEEPVEAVTAEESEAVA